MKYAYVRASTRKQYRDGNELLKQKSKLQEAGFDELVVEEFGETTNTRPCFEVLKARLQAGDTLLVTTLDRVARSATEGVELIKEFLKRGVAVHILNMGLIDNTPAGKLIIRILLAFVEYERALMIERTQVGKETARTRKGFRDGRPPIDQKKKTSPQISSSIDKRAITKLLN